jgi:hypothetical protein
MAQTVEQLETRLEGVRAAIDRAINAHSYSLAGRQHVNQSLKELRAVERSLVLQIRRMQGGAVVLSDFSRDEGRY